MENDRDYCNLLSDRIQNGKNRAPIRYSGNQTSTYFDLTVNLAY